MVKRRGNYVAYYYDKACKDSTPATRLKKIAEILEEGPLESKAARVSKRLRLRVREWTLGCSPAW